MSVSPLPRDAHASAQAAWHWPDESACAQWCAALAAALQALAPACDAFLTLEGPLGAGKTTLVRHLLRALGVQGRIKSPTYTVMEPHALPTGQAVSHFDFYRFNDPREWLDAGFREVFEQPGLKLAEWPQQAAGVLPPEDLALTLEIADDGSRQLSAQAGTARGAGLLAALKAAQPAGSAGSAGSAEAAGSAEPDGPAAGPGAAPDVLGPRA
ncbi:MAG: hypothetical protein RLY78_23 [Pseudomonadota bacterium]